MTSGAATWAMLWPGRYLSQSIEIVREVTWAMFFSQNLLERPNTSADLLLPYRGGFSGAWPTWPTRPRIAGPRGCRVQAGKNDVAHLAANQSCLLTSPPDAIISR
jgi:hypothetical protein